MRILLLILVGWFLLPTTSSAAHLVGGVISYEQTGPNTYFVTLKVYRDCYSTGADFDQPANIGIFKGDYTYHELFEMFDPDVSEIDPSLTGLCDNVDIPACVEEGIYEKTLTLPPSTNGYYIVYQRCCRNGTIVNINVPDDTGNTFVTYIPPPSVVEWNSSPSFNNLPPVALCLNNPLEFDHSATDLDGDELVYSLCTPYSGATPFAPMPVIPSNPPYADIFWAAGYSDQDPIDSDPGMAIDPVTGLLTVNPTMLGQYVIGVCVQEFRDGVLISEVRRDFQFNVVICPSQPVALFADVVSTEDCTTEVTFNNNSENADDYIWDFGDGNTSTEENPVHNYDEGGTYEVTLVVQADNNCVDSVQTEVFVYDVPQPLLLPPMHECVDGENVYDFEVTEIDVDNVDIQFSLNGNSLFADMNVVDHFIFSEFGTHNLVVTVEDDFGCIGTDEIEFTINPPIIAGFTVEDGDCSGLEVPFTSTTENADNISWDFGDLAETPDNNDINFTYTFPDPGVYPVTLTASGENQCPDTYSLDVDVSNPVFIEVILPEPQCQQGNSVDLIHEGMYEEPATFTWTIGGVGDYDTNATDHFGLQATSAGEHQVSLTVVDASNCELTSTGQFVTVDLPEANFEMVNTGCAPEYVEIQNISSGGYVNEYQWIFSDGGTSNEQSPSHVFVEPGTYGVTLVVSSTVGCIGTDSIYVPNAITIYDTPDAGFNITPAIVSILDPEITVTAENDQLNCQFFVSDFTVYDDCYFVHQFEDAGLFEITQIVTNEYGCDNSASAMVRVNGHLFYAPNAVTMNDDGLNDFFKPVVTGDIAEYEIRIYDRWGRIVFESNDHTEAWRPKYSHDGMYHFQVRIRDHFNVASQYSGSFVTVR